MKKWAMAALVSLWLGCGDDECKPEDDCIEQVNSLECKFVGFVVRNRCKRRVPVVVESQACDGSRTAAVEHSLGRGEEFCAQIPPSCKVVVHATKDECLPDQPAM